MRNTLVIGVIGVLLFCGGLAQAEWITIAISGYVTSVSDENKHFGGQIAIGTPITGTYTYDSAIPDSYPSDFSYGQYWNYTPPAGVSLNVGGLNFRTNPDNVEFAVTVNNNNLGEDSYSIWSTKNLSLSDGTLVQSISWYLNDPTGTALSSDALPLTMPDLSKWGYNSLNISTDRTFGISATITSATPEPATAFLFGLGLILARKRFSK
ncbi:MAG: PEP-CTERM sorting domain-containing protein [Sedimentisphaerales bacterium]|jgi:hypothetical protein